MRARLFATAGCIVAAIVLAGCAVRARKPTLYVTARGSALSCSFAVSGQTATTEQRLLVIARREAAKHGRARVKSDLESTPYRCIGAAIYTLQIEGFKDVQFIAEPSLRRGSKRP
jgi:hypothetical protein